MRLEKWKAVLTVDQKASKLAVQRETSSAVRWAMRSDSPQVEPKVN